MKPMTSLERTMAVLDLKVPDRVPVALHNFLMASYMAGGDFSQMLRSGDMLAEAQLAAWREFGHDVIMHENGVCAEAEAMGCGIHYPARGAAHVEDPVIKSAEDLFGGAGNARKSIRRSCAQSSPAPCRFRIRCAASPPSGISGSS